MSDVTFPDPSVATTTEPAEDPGALPRRMLDALFAPVALFRRFRTRAPWWDVLLVTMVLSAAITMVVPREVLVAQIQEALSRNPPAAGAPAPDMEFMVSMARIMGVVGQLVMQPLAALLVAGICTLVFGMLMGGDGTFRQHLAVVTHAGVVSILGLAVTLFFVIQSGNPSTQLSLALLVPGLEADSFTFRVLNALSVFTLWWLALLTAGVAAVNRRVRPIAAGAVVFGLFLVIVAAIAAIRG